MERLFITFLVLGGLALAWLAWQGVKSRLAASIRPTEDADGKPTLLYFTGEYCTACKFQQSPIVEQIRAGLGNAVAVRQVDVSAEPELAGRYKVLTLPTTVVLNPQGQVAAINYGVTRQDKLETQLMAG
ncbi:MAG: thioredoxin [Chloroflexi bacterium]|nr:MAG: thioredoxin [Chloroflexota bacterium]